MVYPGATVEDFDSGAPAAVAKVPVPLQESRRWHHLALNVTVFFTAICFPVKEAR